MSLPGRMRSSDRGFSNWRTPPRPPLWYRLQFPEEPEASAIERGGAAAGCRRLVARRIESTSMCLASPSTGTPHCQLRLSLEPAPAPASAPRLPRISSISPSSSRPLYKLIKCSERAVSIYVFMDMITRSHTAHTLQRCYIYGQLGVTHHRSQALRTPLGSG